MDKKRKIKEEKIIKPKGKILLRLLNIIALVSCALTCYNLYKIRSVGGKLVKFIYIAIVIFILLYLLILFFTSKKLKKQKLLKRNIKKKGLYVSNIIYIIVTVIVTLAIMYLYNYLGSFNKKLVTYSSSLITLSKNDIKDIKDVDDTVIGILSDEKSVEGYIIPKEIIKENKLEDNNQIEEYDSYQEMLADLYSGDLDLMFIASDYVSNFSSTEGYEHIGEETKVIIKKSKKLKKQTVSKRATSSKGKSVTEPFTILLIGIDSEKEGLSEGSGRGDSLILITFNPKTLNATVLSIPRDSYVPIACWSGKPENKITHAAMYGTDCLMDTIENYFGVKIDYYAQINFKGLVSLVNAMGGIDVEVPQDLCTNDSDRNQEICIKGGWQHLDGEGALVLSRNRKQLTNGDIGRGQNQQLVIQAMINKIRTIRSAKDFLKILDTISNNFDTNFTTEQILSFYSVAEDIISNDLAKDDADLVNIEQLYLQGSGQMIYDERAGMVLWDYVPNKYSRDDDIEAMKINLGQKEKKIIKEFSFSVNEEYEKEIIGFGPYKSNSLYSLVPNFIGYSKDQASSIASRNGIRVTFEGTSGYVVSQSAPASKRTDLLGGAVKLTLSNASSKEETEKKSTTTDDTATKKKADDDDNNDGEDKEPGGGTDSSITPAGDDDKTGNGSESNEKGGTGTGTGTGGNSTNEQNGTPDE